VEQGTHVIVTLTEVRGTRQVYLWKWNQEHQCRLFTYNGLDVDENDLSADVLLRNTMLENIVA